MTGRDTSDKKTATGEVFPRERNGYSVSAVNEYIERLNRKFEDTLYDYRRQIVELKRDLEQKTAPAPEDIDKLLEELGESKNKLDEAKSEIERLKSERDALLKQVEQLNEKTERLRALLEGGASRHEGFGMLGAEDEFEADGAEIRRDASMGGPRPVVEFLPPDDTELGSEENAADGEPFLNWLELDSDTIDLNSGSEEYAEGEGEEIYEITPTNAAQSAAAETDESTRADEIVAEARRFADKIVKDAAKDAERLRASRLQKAKEEARAIKHEAYLRARLMLDRVSRKLYAQFEECLGGIADAGYGAHREVTDLFIKLRVCFDDLNFTASDRSKQILKEFDELANGTLDE
ncbi:MAG TPA: hypothetical protein PK778_02010 [Bacillota bacterium]|nr:hypothetical protein [Bacillota bacterium]